MQDLFWFEIVGIMQIDWNHISLGSIALMYFDCDSKNCTFATFFFLCIQKKDDSWFISLLFDLWASTTLK